MINELNKILKSPFIKSFSQLAIGSVISQIIIVACAPFITRIFTPSDIGKYTYFITIATLFMAVINGRYDASIVIEEDIERVYALVKASLLMSIFISILITLTFGAYTICFNKSDTDILQMCILLLIILLSYGVINILTSYNNRMREYKTMTWVYVLRTSCQNIGSIILGIFPSGIYGLIIPYTLGQVLGVGSQARSLKPYFKKIASVTTSKMIEVMKIHYKQPLFSAPALLANSLSYSLTTFFIESLYGMDIVGYYSISARVLGLPLLVVSNNISKVFFEDASREYEKHGRFINSLKKTIIILVPITILMVICLYIFAPPICSILFGREWISAGKYIRILAPMFGIRFIVTSISPALTIIRKQNYDLLLQLLFIIVTTFCFVISTTYHLSVEVFLFHICITLSFAYTAYFCVVLKLSKIKRKVGDIQNV